MGQRFAGRYELVDQLGEGGSGTVWRAWDHRAGGYVAAKLLRQRDAGSLLRFVREQSLRVQHPHVLAPVGWAAEDDDVLLTMELVAGGSLEVLLADYGALPAGLVLALLAQLLEALSAVHAAGIVHRDVKPANLLLEASGTGPVRLRLGDFGIAVLAGEPRLTETGLLIGTPGYVAPEVVRGAAPDPRQDLYSAGVVAWRLLTGHPTSELDEPAALVGLPADLVDWLRTLLAPDPAQRAGSAAAARGALPDGSGPPWRDAGGGEIEVFEHLGPLPAGWGSGGPELGHPVAPPPTALVRAAAGTPLTATLVDAEAPAGAQAAEAPTRPPARLPLVRLAVGGVLLVGGVVAILAAALTSGPDGSAPPAGGGGPAATAGASAGNGDRVVAGAECAFVQVGQRSPTATGTAVCTLTGSSYMWVALP